ncbi:MAG: hypothetical protein K1Y36_24015 [Blastocatellia bacterium]|nr:hypothetical protein [Blastocatellia bacterium]
MTSRQTEGRVESLTDSLALLTAKVRAAAIMVLTINQVELQSRVGKLEEGCN